MYTDKTDPHCQYVFLSDDEERRKMQYIEKWFHIIKRKESRKHDWVLSGAEK